MEWSISKSSNGATDASGEEENSPRHILKGAH